MSGCHNPDTLSLCQHGAPVKFSCHLCDLSRRIENLENAWKECSVSNPIKKIEERFRDIDCSVIELCFKVNDLYKIKEKNDYKKPHKCPVCNSLGFISVSLIESGKELYKNNCHCCDGKGIVWG